MDQIQLENYRNPQKLWEKKITDLNPKEIDLYLDFAEEFLLKNEPPPKDMLFKDQYFPLIKRMPGSLTLTNHATNRAQPCISSDMVPLAQEGNTGSNGSNDLRHEKGLGNNDKSPGNGIENDNNLMADQIPRQTREEEMTSPRQDHPNRLNRRADSASSDKTDRNNAQVRRKELALIKLLFNRALEIIGCSDTNHVTPADFIRMLKAINSCLKKKTGQSIR